MKRALAPLRMKPSLRRLAAPSERHIAFTRSSRCAVGGATRTSLTYHLRTEPLAVGLNYDTNRLTT